MEINEQKRLRKYSAISLGIVLVTAFVLVQPTMQASYADAGSEPFPTLGAEGIPTFDDCELTDFDDQINGSSDEDQAEDSMSMATVRNKDKVLTVHVEKEKYECFLDQGNLRVTVELDLHLQIYENITSGEVLSASALVTTCLKHEDTAQVIGCESYVPSTSPVPVGSECEPIDEGGTVEDLMKHPQEMNMVTKGKIAKEIVAQKEIWTCPLDNIEGEDFDTWKKVDVVIFTEVFKDLNTMTDTNVQFLQWRCVTLITDDDNEDEDDTLPDGTVESCIFSTVPT